MNYFIVLRNKKPIAILEQHEKDDSIGPTAKETAILNGLRYERIPMGNISVFCKHHDIQRVAACNFGYFLTEKGIVPY